MSSFIVTVFFILLVVFSECRGVFITNDDVAVRALENQGFTNIRVVDGEWFFVGLRGCGSDAKKITARAVNLLQKEVNIFVCVGWPFKGATVRSN